MVAILYLVEPRLEYIAFLEDGGDGPEYHPSVDPLFSVLFAETSP